MTATPAKPFRRHESPTLRVRGADGFGQPITLEVQSQEWLNARTGRYRRVWSARRVGRLGWDAASSPRVAIARAAGIRASRRPAWLREAVEKAAKLR